MWDVSGDPCPAVKYEWAVEQTDGTVIQEFIEIGSYFVMTDAVSPTK